MEKQTRITKVKQTINNLFYDHLGKDWIDRSDHPVALLRAENAIRAPWIAKEIKDRIGNSIKILDIGCGAGFLTNHLALEGHTVTGIDLSEPSLEIAKAQDITKSINYINCHAYCLPFLNDSFDVVCATDVLEHVEDPHLLIAEASRVLNTGGLFFFHTFNRNPLSYLLIIKGVEWFVSNTPKNLHMYPLFIKPQEIEDYLQFYNLEPICWRGLEPKIFSFSLLKMLFTGKIPPTFSFRFTRSLKTGYCGIAIKGAN